MTLRSLVFGVALAGGCAGSASLQSDIAEATPAELDAKKDAAHQDLTATQEKAVLTQLNNICGDTWCDGDWTFDFKKLVCKLDLGSCTWTALITPSVPATEKLVFWRSCKVTGVHAFADLVTTTNGYSSLDQDYYMASTECVQRIEAKLPTYTPAP